MKIYINGKNIDTTPLKRLMVQGETNVDAPEFELARKYEGLDLNNLTFAIRAVSEKDTIVEALLQKTSTTDKVRLKWTITEDFTAVSGPLRLEIRGTNAAGTTIIKMIGDPVLIKETPEASGLPPRDVITAALSQLQARLETALNTIDTATDEAIAECQSDLNQKVSLAQTAAQTAATKASAAAAQAEIATTAADTAQTKAQQAAQSAQTATDKAAQASASQTAAKASQTASKTSQTAAKASEMAAQTANTAAQAAKTSVDKSAQIAREAADSIYLVQYAPPAELLDTAVVLNPPTAAELP